jgi:hypothetical protein
VWPWLLQIGRGRAGFYTYAWIENLLGADIANLDHVEPTLQRLEPGDRIWMTPERYLGRLPGQFWRVRKVEAGRAIVLERRPPDSRVPASWTLLVEPSSRGGTRLIDRHRGERSPGPLGRVSDAIWLAGTLLMEREMLRGIRARAEMHPEEARRPQG